MTSTRFPLLAAAPSFPDTIGCCGNRKFKFSGESRVTLSVHTFHCLSVCRSTLIVVVLVVEKFWFEWGATQWPPLNFFAGLNFNCVKHFVNPFCEKCYFNPPLTGALQVPPLFQILYIYVEFIEDWIVQCESKFEWLFVYVRPLPTTSPVHSPSLVQTHTGSEWGQAFIENSFYRWFEWSALWICRDRSFNTVFSICIWFWIKIIPNFICSNSCFAITSSGPLAVLCASLVLLCHICSHWMQRDSWI